MMKFHRLSALLLLALFAHCFCEPNPSGDNASLPYDSPIEGTIRLNGIGNEALNDVTVAGENVNNNLAGSVRNTIRNTTNLLVQGIEKQRIRVMQMMRPAIKSDFSRNVTNVLSSIWNRVQETNSSIIQNPLFRNSIIIPINTTMKKLKEMTSGDDEAMKFEIINLNRPESEKELRSFLKPDANSEDAASSPAVIVLVRGDEKKSKSSQTATNSQLTDRVNNRTPRYMDQYYYNRVEPTRIREMFDSVQQENMQECMALALCESNCRPHLYSHRRAGLFRRLFDRIEELDFDHSDYDYYQDARRHGQRYSGSNSNECRMCHARYNCQHERENMIDRLYSMGRFD